MFVGIGAAVCAVIALVLVKIRRLPKVAAVFAFGAGGGIGGWLAGMLATGASWINTAGAYVVGVGVLGLVGIALVILLVNDMNPKGGKAAAATVAIAFAVPIVLGLTGGELASGSARLSGAINDGAASAYSRLF